MINILLIHVICYLITLNVLGIMDHVLHSQNVVIIWFQMDSNVLEKDHVKLFLRLILLIFINVLIKQMIQCIVLIHVQE